METIESLQLIEDTLAAIRAHRQAGIPIPLEHDSVAASSTPATSHDSAEGAGK